MQTAPDAAVVKWLDRQPVESIWTTSITILEIRTGLELMPHGRRRQTLELVFGRILEQELEHRVLDFDTPATLAAALLTAEHQRAGRTPEVRDMQIAGIVIAKRATLATRNVRHFADISAPVINPWTA